MATPLSPALDRRVLADTLDHVEGVCWDPARGCLWAGGEAGQIYRIELDGSLRVTTTIVGGALLGLALDGEGNLYCCDPGNHRVWRIDERGAATPFGNEIDFPNYAAFHDSGRLFVSDSGSFDEPTGRLWAIDPSGETSDVTPRPLAYANGLAVRANEVWIVESSLPAVSVLNLDDGSIRRAIELDRCNPDGLAFDAEGGLLISCYQPNHVWRWSEAGGLDLLLDDWTGEYVLSPTNLAFYGEDLSRVALASLCGHSLVTIDVGRRGVAPYYPIQGGRDS